MHKHHTPILPVFLQYLDVCMSEGGIGYGIIRMTIAVTAIGITIFTG